MSILLALWPLLGRAGFVYETTTEFLASGDFNGDGTTDVLVLDRASGNARVGYLDNSGNITWSLPLPTGVPAPDGLTVGRFHDSSTDGVAITAIELNRVHLLRLSDPSNAPVPALLTPHGLGPSFLVGLSAPAGVVSNYDSLYVGSSANNSNLGQTYLEQWAFTGDAVSAFQESSAQPTVLARGNALFLASDPVSYAAALQRGPTNDQFVAYAPSNHFAVVLSLPGLAPGSDYVFGTFNNETSPRFLFYVPGQSNLIVHSLVPTNGAYIFDAGIVVNVSEAIQNVYYVSTGPDGVAVVRFGDGVQGLTLPAGSPVLTAAYRSGGGDSGNTFTGIIPLTNGNFALLDAPAGSGVSTHAQVVHFDGSGFTQLTSSALPPVSGSGTRANVWLFQLEPFVNSNPNFLGSFKDPDWSSIPLISSGVVSARTETDGGSSSGLTNPVTNNLGPAPTGASFAMPNQYGDSISIFTYAPPRPAEPIVLSISPPPGLYGGPITVSISTVSGSPKIYHRFAPQGTYTPGSSFVLSNDTTVQYYGTNPITVLRSRLYTAAYTFGRGNAVQPASPLDLAPGSTNPAPVFNTNLVSLSDVGTVFYGRRATNQVGSIWAINLDGTGETYITQGARPRVSRDGQWLAFLRDGAPFSNLGDLWVRNLTNGTETMLFSNTNQLIGYDWDLSDSRIIFDYTNRFFKTALTGPALQLGIAPGYNQGAPTVNPIDGRIVFQSLYPGPAALYMADSEGTFAQALPFGVTGPMWPYWSPDGEHLAFADSYVTPSVDSGRNLWVAELTSTYTNVYQITTFSDPTNGFPHGAVWSADGTELVGAGIVNGTNGIWVIPLNFDCMCSDEPLLLLPTSSGDSLDFAGTVLAAPPVPGSVMPGLFIRLDPDSTVVYWSTAFQGFVLESAPDLSAPVWTPLPPPYTLNGYYYEFREPLANLATHKYFRLHYTAP